MKESTQKKCNKALFIYFLMSSLHFHSKKFRLLRRRRRRRLLSEGLFEGTSKINSRKSSIMSLCKRTANSGNPKPQSYSSVYMENDSTMLVVIINFITPRQNLEFSKRNFFYCGAQTWTEILLHTRVSPMITSLKRN